MTDNTVSMCVLCGKHMKDGITYWKHLNGFAHPECVGAIRNGDVIEWKN